MNIGRNFLIERVIKYWNGLPKDVVESLSLVKERLDVALGDTVSLTTGVVWPQVGLDFMSFPS